jgi:RNA polymerase sigma-70 factor (ECF subfamily)
VLDAQEDDPVALAEICRSYWFPLYCYARRLCPAVADAEDLTQAFFESILSRQSLKSAKEDRGRLRSFLLTSMKNFSIQQHRKRTAQKRGGNEASSSLDLAQAEARFARESRDARTPEVEFDRAWARELLAGVLVKLGEGYRAAGKGEVFEALQDQLTGGGVESYGPAMERLGLSQAAVRFAAFKLRERYRGMLQGAIRETVTSDEEAVAELNHLKEIFAIV